jgi:transcriptional regulator with XRE-family HTH domain
MKKKDIRDEFIRKEIGLRIKEFRKSIKKYQYELAEELKSSQSTFTSIETGKIYPCSPFLNYLHLQYNLNLNWLLTGKGEMIISPEVNSFRNIIDDERYVELISLMRIPAIEEIILARLAEVKVIAKEEIKEFCEPKHVDQ